MIPRSQHRIVRIVSAILIAGSSQLALLSGARADEGGVPFWLSGSYSSLVAVPQEPGWYMPTVLYYYSGNANASKSFQRGADVVAGVSGDAFLVFVAPTWVPNEKWFGGQPSFTLMFGDGRVSTSADLSVTTGGGSQTFKRSDSKTGGSDLYPQAQIAWNRDYHNWMVYLTGDVPVGAYDSKRLSNVGIGHTAIDAGGAYTYMNTKGGFEASAALGFTYNNQNTDTDYQNGTDSHLDWDISQFLSDNWQIGVMGYAYYQLTDDGGSGNRVGSFKSRVAAAGPEVAYAFKAGGQQWYANLRGYSEFWAEHRLEGYAVFGTISIPLGRGAKKGT